MRPLPAGSQHDFLDGVVSIVQERIAPDQTHAAEVFVHRFYRHVDPDDLQGRSPLDLYGAAVSQWNFLRQTSEAASQVRVYNPRVEEHGWQCPHTVVEIVHPDMPFLVDSVRMEVNAQGFTTHLIIHPIVPVRRNGAREIAEVVPIGTAADDAQHYSVMHLEVSRKTERATLRQLEEGLARVLADVRAAVGDWQPMLERLREIVAELRRAPPPLPEDELSEGIAFLEWLGRNQFTFLGGRDYELVEESGEDVLRVVPGSGLGILRDRGEQPTSTSFASLPPEIRERARKRELMIVTKSNTRATVHRPAYADYIGIKRFDAAGNVIGERRFLGLYTSMAYSTSALDIPVLRRKVRAVIDRSGATPGSHTGKALLTILETYPRDELFQVDEDDLFRIAMGILHLQERQRTRLFVRRDPFGRFFSCLVYVPRDNYNTDVRQRMQRLLMAAFDGVSSEFSVNLSESVLARVLILVHTKPGTQPDYDERELEAQLARVSRRWEDDLAQALAERLGEERGSHLYQIYGAAFPAGYREDCLARAAVHDIEVMETLGIDNPLGMSMYRPLEAGGGELRFKLFHLDSAVALSNSLPMLEHMGVRVIDERPYEIERSGGTRVWIHDMGLATGLQGEVDVDAIREPFQDTFLRVWRGDAEADDFNRLVLRAGLAWREVSVLRALAKYARQTGFTFSQAYMEATLAGHPPIVRQLVDLFIERHDPHRAAPAKDRGGQLAAAIEGALEGVASLDEDRILRRFLALILAVTRTNYFQRGANAQLKPYLSFKFDPSKIPGLPEPRPMFEIYVYAPRVEGVHLRGGRVARGGLRWSDRMEDFRTEVLGLMKAQMVKNAIIVPVGAKGGFVVKRAPAGDREALMREVTECYRNFVRGLLDLTDNRSADAVIPPPDVLRHDTDDPYLVVAADKGTATFSDIANGVAAEYGFWLGDAFASGGSSGYDHKRMGITARGAWESVKKHFRSLGIDIQTTPFTVVGIGDMSGDVFGNGMLCSPCIRLLAAFDHRHIFVDPDPDPQTSFRERERLFRLPRSSWADYDRALLSEGGGIYPRTAKSIRLSEAVRRVLGIEAVTLTPNELIRAILSAPADLLYNGGIGTYVKASEEEHADAGDRSNDPVRVDASELRCRVVGEGGNLGFTQRARVEFALRGGLVHTDAIDNSAGVDCSDHEVNIKILLNAVVAAGDLTLKQRDRLLEQMTDDVAGLVLRDNYYQAQCLAVSGVTGATGPAAEARFMRFLERSGKLNRELEFLPADDVLAARGGGLAAPERAVLLAYGKLWLFDELSQSSVPEDPFIATALERYFPKALRGPYADAMQRHPLKREIIATHVCNSMVNRVGSTFVHRLMEEAGARPSDVVRAYLLARETFRIVPLWLAIDALDNTVADAEQMAMLMRVRRLIVRASLWFLRKRLQSDDLSATIRRLEAPVASVVQALESYLGEQDRERLRQSTEQLAGAGVPSPLAGQIAGTELAYAALDITDLAHAHQRDVAAVATVYFALAARLNASWLRDQIGLLPTETHWQALARAALRDELAQTLCMLTAAVLSRRPEVSEPAALIGGWEEGNRSVLARVQQVLSELQAAASRDLAMMSVALRELRNLA